MERLSAARNVAVNMAAEKEPVAVPSGVPQKEAEAGRAMSRAISCSPGPEGFGKAVDKSIKDTSMAVVMEAIKTISRLPSLILFR